MPFEAGRASWQEMAQEQPVFMHQQIQISAKAHMIDLIGFIKV